jgi:hypothetical protein
MKKRKKKKRKDKYKKAKESKSDRTRIIGKESNANEISQPANDLAEKPNTEFHP